MRRLLLLAGVGLLAGVVGYLLGRPHVGEFTADYIHRRAYVIESQGKQAGPGQLLLIGDSIVERQQLPRLCGLASVNAGISMARSSDLLPLAPRAIAAVRPSRVVFATGANDAQVKALDVKRWAAETARLIGGWRGRPIVVGVPTAPWHDARQIEQMNQALRGIAARRGGVYLAPSASADTHDGIHLSPAGAQRWQRRVAAACGRLGSD